MFCSSCGKFLDEGTQFCPSCGKKVSPVISIDEEAVPKLGVDVASPSRPPEQDPAKAEKRKKRAKIMWISIATVAAIAIILGVVIPKVRYARKQASYNSAAALYKSGDYEAAREAFLALADFEDAAEQADICSEAMTYQQAMALYQSGDYEAAAQKFAEVDNFQDADTLEKECLQRVSYAKAVALMKSGEYETAEGVLASLDENLFPDKTALLTQCKDQILEERSLADYQKAQQALAEGQRYEAYELFHGLGDFQDSAALAESCIVTKPDSGQTYYNSAYSGDDCTLEINPPSDGSSTYAKIYTPGGDLVACLFMNPGDTASVNLPAGNYCIRVAYGYGDWFGEKDIFGDDGVYQQLLMSDYSENFTFEYDYAYTLTLQTTDKSGVSVANKNVDRDSF